MAQPGTTVGWLTTPAHVDDPSARLDTFGDERHASLVRRFGTSLLSIRIDLSG